VKSFIIRRELKIGKGDIYSRKNIEKSQKSIYGTGLFDFVGIELKALENNRSQVLLMIKVVEKKSKWVGARFGVAYEQEIVYGGTFDFTLEFGHRNLFGTARSIYVDVVPSLSYDFNDKKLYNPKNQFSFTYVEPWIAYTKTPGIVRFSYYQVRPLNSADYDYYTSSFLVRHEFENFWKVSGMLAYNRVQILDEDSLSYEFFRQTEGQDYIYSITSSATRDRRDNYLNPQGGSLIDLNLRFAYAKSRSNETGEITDNRFIKTVVEWNRYQKFRYYRKWILATRLKAGNVIEFGKRSKIPVSERFFLGGASTVRGYREQLLGPIIYDEEGKNPRAVGGKLMFLANLEFRIPLFWLFWGEIFLDAGNVWIENDFLNIEDIKSSSGIGLALLTPLGPIRFDYGIKISPEENESKGEFHISISFAF
jgi:outer membrane protein insertion porin family